MMPTFHHWQSVDPPYVELLVLREGQSPDQVITPPSEITVRIIRGENCRTKDELLSEFDRAFSFPDYFGENWDAFEECIRDLEWLPAAGYLAIITEAEQVLGRSSREEYLIFISILQNAGKEWATPRTGEWPRPAIPFHVVFVVSESSYRQRNDWHLPVAET